MGVMNKFMNFLGLQEEEEVIEKERIVEQLEEPETNAFEARSKQKSNIVSIHSQKNVKLVLNEPRNSLLKPLMNPPADPLPVRLPPMKTTICGPVLVPGPVNCS